LERVAGRKLAVIVDKRKVSEEPRHLVQCVVAVIACSHSHLITTSFPAKASYLDKFKDNMGVLGPRHIQRPCYFFEGIRTKRGTCDDILVADIGSPPKIQAHFAHNGINNGVAVRGMPYDDRGRGNKASREPSVRVRFDRNPEIIKVPKCLNEAKLNIGRGTLERTALLEVLGGPRLVRQHQKLTPELESD